MRRHEINLFGNVVITNLVISRETFDKLSLNPLLVSSYLASTYPCRSLWQICLLRVVSRYLQTGLDD